MKGKDVSWYLKAGKNIVIICSICLFKVFQESLLVLPYHVLKFDSCNILPQKARLSPLFSLWLLQAMGSNWLCGPHSSWKQLGQRGEGGKRRPSGWDNSVGIPWVVGCCSSHQDGFTMSHYVFFFTWYWSSPISKPLKGPVCDHKTMFFPWQRRLAHSQTIFTLTQFNWCYDQKNVGS